MTDDPYPGAYPHLVYYTTDDGVYYHCAFCGFDKNLGFYGNTNDAARARDEHDATPCPRRELPTGVDQQELDEAEKLRRELLQQLQDAAEAVRKQAPQTVRRMPIIDPYRPLTTKDNNGE